MLNADMEKIYDWASKCLVTFNPSKSESLLFSRKHNKPYRPPVTMNGETISGIDTHRIVFGMSTYHILKRRLGTESIL